MINKQAAVTIPKSNDCDPDEEGKNQNYREKN